MYNDYGSVKRDKDEGNLNSINFPEFQSPSESTLSKQEDQEQLAKTELMYLAEYERQKLEELHSRRVEAFIACHGSV
ncbi:hypothetical protein GGR54DRAFT_591656 [Hypoxylon sp. NC1633]|nr:hypothetical protein GGR54DRAFT_591656 [Hypoxylon sp. NC1633]